MHIDFKRSKPLVKMKINSLASSDGTLPDSKNKQDSHTIRINDCIEIIYIYCGFLHNRQTVADTPLYNREAINPSRLATKIFPPSPCHAKSHYHKLLNSESTKAALIPTQLLS